MKAEIIAVGTEILNGDVLDTNTHWIAQQLHQYGVIVSNRHVVGDSQEDLARLLKQAAQKADLIILTGGLGPTYDDITKDVVADICGLPLREDPYTKKVYEDFFKQRRQSPTANNQRQTLIPQNALPLANYAGLAPGIDLLHQGVRYILLPGPPREMQTTFQESLLPRLFPADHDFILTQNIHLYGIGEAEIDDRLKDIMPQLTNPTLAPYVSGGEVTLRIRTQAKNKTEAEQLSSPLIQLVADHFPEHYYGVDMEGLQEAVGILLRKKNATIATAESCTGGLVVKRLTDLPGSSDYVLGGLCSYANSAKINLLDVPADIIKAHGAVSQETALAMAEGAARHFQADYAISTTGVAGPGTSEHKRVGFAWIGLHSPEGTTAFPFQASPLTVNDRQMVRSAVTKAALYALWKSLK